MVKPGVGESLVDVLAVRHVQPFAAPGPPKERREGVGQIDEDG